MAQLTQPIPSTGPRHSSPEPRRRRRVRAHSAGGQQKAGPIAYALVILATVLSLFPLYWTVVAASRTDTELVTPPTPLLPGSHLIDNLKIVWDQVDMTTALINSTIVAGCVALSTVLFATLAGFAFAKLEFRGRNALLTVVVATMTIPPQLTVIPLYQIITNVGWVGHIQSVILPSLVAAFGVFFMRQFLSEALPVELVEAARVDGAHSLRIIWHVVFPIARPAMAVLGMLVFVQSWNDFFWPFIALNQQNPTVQVALQGLGSGDHTINHAVVVCGALVATLPLLLVFAVLGRQIVGGITAGAVKS
ncbi:putative cellobiose ABC transporter permease [Actinacidiphila reveromycinica]|uniref:Putative cellobiose ABC transporter permease n=1 Tax=Actinacidiphila reveromycinica TaxID=659352 RepID=A0A7U3VND3_9ACTN|nr:carbohydrate ABC transporter permease [Streptomyces sp. SN-593]BBA97543.1 putative cellobiose ABC transporter permease [Streptomyces sp. SN-593]